MLDEQTFRAHLSALVPAAKAKSFLLAVSGGADSMVMAYLFDNEQLHYEVAHCNFHLRAAESDRDMQFVKSCPQFQKTTVHIKEFDTLALQENSGNSIEMVARDLRYQWFSEIGRDFDYIVTAHHADDNAETLLLNLARGTGLKGLTAIPEQNGKILRPLLPFSAADIRNFAAKRGIAFCEDSSNASDHFQRNKMRLHVIPALKNVNPNIIQTISEDILTFRKQYSFYQKQIEFKKQQLIEQREESFYLSINQLLIEENAELLLYECLTDFNFNKSVIADIFAQISQQAGKLFYSKTHQLLKDRDFLIVTPYTEELATAIIIADLAAFEKCGFSAQLIDYQQDMNFSADKNTIFVDADKLTFPLLLRTWQPGDSLVPFGRKKLKKISDLLINEKVDRFAKQQQQILCNEDKIVWLVGLRADDRFKVEAGRTKRILKIVKH